MKREARQITTLSTALGALGAGLLGTLAVAGSFSIDAAAHPLARSLVHELGVLMWTSVAVGVVFQLMSKRALAAEVRDAAGLSLDVARSGVVQVTCRFYDDVDWTSLIGRASQADFLFAYGATWKNKNVDALRQLAQNPNARVRLLVPDPDDPPIVEELARRFGKDAKSIQGLIRETVSEFQDIFRGSAAALTVLAHRATPVFTAYRLDDRLVVALYKHRKERQGAVPTLVLDRDGSFFAFVRDEIEALASSGREVK